MSHNQPFYNVKSARSYILGGLGLTVLLLAGSGCNSFGNSRLVKELQSENDRLLAEFRAQRTRSEELEKSNQLQAQRLAESEKLLARLSQGGGPGRVSSLPTNLPSSTSQFGFGSSPAGSSPTGSFPSGSSSAGESAGAYENSLADPSSLKWQPRVGKP